MRPFGTKAAASSGVSKRAGFLSRKPLSLATLISKEDQKALGIEVHPRRFFKATKQLATLGPASSSAEMVEKLFLSGADIFRLNFSHGEYEEKKKLVRTIRDIEEKYNHPIAILADLQVYSLFDLPYSFNILSGRHPYINELKSRLHVLLL